MGLREFQEFVREHAVLFKGPTCVSSELIEQAELQLKVTFPEEFCWLLEHYGIWNGTGIQAIQWIVASSLRLKNSGLNSRLLVLSQTTPSQFDRWRGETSQQLQSKRWGYLLWEFNEGNPGRLIWLRVLRHEEINQHSQQNFASIPHLEFRDFTDYLTQRVTWLTLHAISKYEACPHDKPLTETPLVVSQEEFPWKPFLEKLGETISWNMVRSKYPLTLPEELVDPQEPDWISELVYIQETRRHMLLSGGYQADSYYAMIGSSCRPIIKPAENLAGGDMLLTPIQYPQALPSPNHQTPLKSTINGIILDEAGRPPPDYWVCQFVVQQHLPEYFLVSWIPPGLYPQTNLELTQLETKCPPENPRSIWLTEGPFSLKQHFQERQLIN